MRSVDKVRGPTDKDRYPDEFAPQDETAICRDDTSVWIVKGTSMRRNRHGQDDCA